MMSTKLVTSGLPEIKIFGNKGQDVIILDYDVNNTILSSDSNYLKCDQCLVTIAFL